MTRSGSLPHLFSTNSKTFTKALWILFGEIMSTPLNILIRPTGHLQRPSRHEDMLPTHDHRPHASLAILLPPFPIMLRILLKHPVGSKRSPQSPSSRVLRGVEVGELAPIDTGEVIRELGDVGMGYHSLDIMSNEVNLVLDANMLCDQLV